MTRASRRFFRQKGAAVENLRPMGGDVITEGTRLFAVYIKCTEPSQDLRNTKYFIKVFIRACLNVCPTSSGRHLECFEDLFDKDKSLTPSWMSTCFENQHGGNKEAMALRSCPRCASIRSSSFKFIRLLGPQDEFESRRLRHFLSYMFCAWKGVL